jgi:Uma2 family endonuclease
VVEITAEELAINFRHAGSTTFKRKDLSQGFEADSCFYIQQEAKVRALKKIDLDVDPPPDLVIEIDITNSSLSKFPIYLGLGVPEVWRYARRRVTISRLERGRYVKAKRSSAFPLLTDEVLTRFLRAFPSMPRVDFLRSVRTWVRDQVATAQE